MRQVTFNKSINEIEIHPPHTYQTFQKLAKESLRKLDKTAFVELTSCPACNNNDIKKAFSIWDIDYFECNQCASIFAKSRPNPEQMTWYLNESQTAKFRQSSEHLTAMELSYAKLTNYRSSWVNSVSFQIPSETVLIIIDLETRTNALLQAYQHQNDATVIIVEPKFSKQTDIKICSNIEKVAYRSVSILMAFDVLEHQPAPEDFFQTISSKIQPHGFLLLTSRAGSGFDIQILRENCPTIVPIEHLNLISVEGIKHLLDIAGFHLIEISSPGQLDVQVVKQALNKSKTHSIPNVIQYFLKNRDLYAKHNLQNILQSNLLSSHLRLIA